MERPYASSAHVYDLLYAAAGKDYERDAAELHTLIQRTRPGATSLLDVACGTGMHLLYLSRHYDVAGIDLEPAMAAVARTRLPGASVAQGDMRSFGLDRSFDVITCLGSAIGYMGSPAELDQAIAAFRRHLSPGGIVIVDGWVRRASWRDPGTVQVLSASGDGVAVARVVRSRRDGVHTTLELQHLIGSVDGIEHVVETHALTLFGDDEYRAAFERAVLAVETVASPHPDRDRYVGTAR